LAAGLPEHPGFDLLSKRPDGEERCIEVKGRAGTEDIELTENEWVKACNLKESYWLYVVLGCESPLPRLYRVQDPFRRLLVSASWRAVLPAAEVMSQSEA
jgi:hypothetical protein